MDVLGSPRWHALTQWERNDCPDVIRLRISYERLDLNPRLGDGVNHLSQSCISKFEGQPVYSSQGFPGLQRGKSQTTKPQLTTIMDKLTSINHPASVLGRTGRKRSANYVTFEELISVLNYNF